MCAMRYYTRHTLSSAFDLCIWLARLSESWLKNYIEVHSSIVLYTAILQYQRRSIVLTCAPIRPYDIPSQLILFVLKREVRVDNGQQAGTKLLYVGTDSRSGISHCAIKYCCF